MMNLTITKGLEFLKKSCLLFFAITVILPVKASDIKEVLPLTNKVLMLHFDDGSVTYPTTLDVDRLDIEEAEKISNFTISSSDDANFGDGVNPLSIGRKTKGTEFVHQEAIPWDNNKRAYNPEDQPWAAEHWLYLELESPLQQGKEYTVSTGSLAANGQEWTFVFDEKQLRSEAVHVNTIGYATNAPKYGYIYQWMGDKGNLDLTAYKGNTFWLYETTDLENPVKTGTISKRKSADNPETGQPDDTPNRNFLGAEVYEAEFSDVTADGTYILVVEGIGKSYEFRIGEDAVWDAYYTCARSLYYQRSGIRLEPPYTDDGYIRPVTQNTKVTSDDGTDFSNLLLYSEFPWMSWNGEGGGNTKQDIKDAAAGNYIDVAGWYHDAGDWDAYWTHQRIPALLMLTYEYAPERFADNDLNIPESGNGIPDIVDEASWLIKFNYRVKKELMAKGFSDGGVGGARVCPDVYNDEDGNAQSDKPSWKDHRRYIMAEADAFMTYFYAGQAAQFAVILKKLGKNPENFPVEMLDAASFDDMSYDNVNWIQEAKEAYAWAGASENQPESSNNYGGELGVYRMYAAVSLFRLTGENQYHEDAMNELNKIAGASKLDEDERYGVYSYLLSDNYNVDKLLQSNLKTAAVNNASFRGLEAAEKRATRWGGVWDMPMLVGQGTTPWVFENIIAYKLTGEQKYDDVVHTTADYFLGTNPLHSTWATGLGPRPAQAGFHLDSRYNNDWEVYPGFVPYGPWRLSDMTAIFTWTIDGIQKQGGMGPWDKHWHNFSLYPLADQWPGHEFWCANIHSPMSAENTVHQNSVYVGLTYGYVNARHNMNNGSEKPVTTISLNKTQIEFTSKGQTDTLVASLDIEDATFSQLKWESSDPRVVHVDETGRVTSVTTGSATITCSTLDGSVVATCTVNCSWAAIDVESIEINPGTLNIVEGQTRMISVLFTPEDATNQFVNWTYEPEGIATVDENNILTANSAGSALVIATSLDGNKKDTCEVTVGRAQDFIIADFDEVIPVTSTTMTDSAQFYTPGGTNNIQADNPLKGDANNSDKVVEYNRPEGQWKLIGCVLPTDSFQELSQYAQFQFKYFGAELNEFYFHFTKPDGSKIAEPTISVEGEDCWKLFTYDLSTSDSLKQFNIFVNARETVSFDCYFDNFKLVTEAAVPYDDIELSDGYIELAAGGQYQISAEAEGNPFSFVSADPGVAIVDQDGNITAKGAGETTIKAVPLYGKSAECTVKVSGGCPPVNIPDPLTVLDFESIQLNWSGGYGGYGWNTNVLGIVDNPSSDAVNSSSKVCSWEKDGSGNKWGGFSIVFPATPVEHPKISLQLYATSDVETFRIEAEDADGIVGEQTLNDLAIPANQWTEVSFDVNTMGISGKSLTKITFQPAGGSEEVMTLYIDNVKLEADFIDVTGIEISDASKSSGPGDTYQLSASLTPNDATDQCILWSSSDENVVTVDESGLIYAVGEGNADITASSRDGGYSAVCAVTVGQLSIPVAGITVSPDELSLEINETKSLTATIIPEDASDKSYTWSSDKESVAIVDVSTGLVTAVGEGVTNITATSNDGNFTDECIITVVSPVIPVTGIDVSPDELTLKTGDTEVLIAIITPEDATDKSFSWSSGNESVAAVDASSGLVTAVSKGEAEIIATSGDGDFTDKCVVTVTETNAIESVNRQQSISVFPNPAKESFTILSDNEIQSVQIIDLSGKLLDINEHIGSRTYKNDISYLARGAYFIKILTANKHLTVKKLFVK